MASERNTTLLRETLLREGCRQYQCLLDEARGLLTMLDALGPVALQAALQRRQEIVDSLQDFDARFEVSAGGGEPLAEFRAFREEATRKILEVDGLVIALAREKQATIKEKLASLTRSKSVSQAYEPGHVARPPSWVNESI